MDLAFYKLVGVVLYLAVLLGIGVAASRRMHDMGDYFAAGKKLGFWSVAFSSRATGESGWLLLGLTGLGATAGVRGFWVVLGEVLGVAGAWLLLARPFNRLTQSYGSLTIPDYLASRFRDDSHRIRVVAAFALTVFVTIYVAAQIYATGQAFRDFLGWNWYVGVAIGFAVVMAYSISGGFLAVVWSDVFQGALMFVGLVGLPLVGLVALGGFTPLMTQLTAIDPTLLALGGADGWTVNTIAGTIGFVMIGLGFLGSPQIFVRFLALRDEREISKGAAVALIWTLLADSGAVATGMIGRVMLTTPGQAVEPILGAGAEGVLPLMVSAVLPPLLVGLFIAIVLSAIMSTVDSLLVLASSAAVRDLYQQVWHPELPDDRLLGLSRLATFAIALVALGVAIAATGPDQTIFWFVIFGWSGIAATFCPTLILSIAWRGMTARGAIAAMIAGFVGVPLFKFAGPLVPGIGDALAALGELPPSFALSLLVGVAVSWLDAEGRARLADVGEELARARA